MQSRNLILFLFVLILGCDNSRTPLPSKELDIISRINTSRDTSLTSKDRLMAINQGLSIAKTIKPDSLLVAVLLQKSNLHFKLKQNDSVLFYDRVLLRSSILTKSDYYIGKASFNLALYHKSKNSYDSAYYYYNKSKSSFLKLNDSVQTGRRLLSMAIIQQDQSDFFGSKETITEALKYLTAAKDQKYIASAYSVLGTNHRKLFNPSEAILYYKKAIETSEIERDILVYKNNLAAIYIQQKDYKTALELLKFNKDEIKLLEDIHQLERVKDNLAYAKWRYKGADVAEELLGNLKTRVENKDWNGQISSYAHLSDFYYAKDKLASEKYLLQGIKASKKSQNPTGELEALEKMMVLRPKDIFYKDRYIFLKDSLYQQELKVKTQFAKMKYDDEQEKAHLMALETEAAQKEVQLAQQETQKILFLSLSAILLMGGTSLLFLLKQRHKKEKLKEIYNTEKHISQRLHDGLANDIFSLMAQVENKEQTQNIEFLDQLEKIYARTRDISHENSSINTTESFLNELKNLIHPFHGNGTTIITKGLEDIQWTNLSEQKCVALHRALKELMVNMKKHSQASLVGLQFSNDKKSMKLNYNDNGIGFPSEIKYGLGLQNTVSRIQSCGGTFIFNPKQGTGVSIEISIPY